MDRILVSCECASLTSWKEGDPDVERPNSSRSAPVLRFAGCNAFARTGPANPCPAEEALRHWRNIRGRSSHSSARNGTSRWMRLFRRFISGASQAAAVPSRAFSLAMASPSKKSLRAAERKRADVARARRRWIREQGFLDPAHLVFIDETAVTTNMLRLNGWSPRGERLISDAPMGHWETGTFIAGLRQTRIVAPMLIKAAEPDPGSNRGMFRKGSTTPTSANAKTKHHNAVKHGLAAVVLGIALNGSASLAA